MAQIENLENGKEMPAEENNLSKNLD